MLKRKIEKNLIEWKDNHHSKCLLVKGARQVGKTFSIREFGKKYYKSFIELNFFERPELKDIFVGSLSPDEIYKKISSRIPGCKFIDKETLIFLDEIQECPLARTAEKFLAIDDRFDIIASGSMLGINFKGNDEASIPVGYETELTMYSLSFEEFLMAYGYDDDTILWLQNQFNNKSKIEKTVIDKYQELIREYMVVGGMPEVVETFFNTENYNDVYRNQLDILQKYKEDIIHYASTTMKQKIIKCYESLPKQLGKETKRFQYSVVEKNATAKKYGTSINWLIDAGFVKKCNNVNNPVLPLKAYVEEGQYKLYSTDIGLLTAMFGYESKMALLNNEFEGPAKGGIYENLIFDILIKNSNDLNYYKDENSTKEIEFLIEKDRAVIPIEVKSKIGNTVSLNYFIDTYKPPYAYKLIDGNIGKVDCKITMPHFMAMFI